MTFRARGEPRTDDALNTDRLSYYESAFTELRERLIRVLGAPTVTRLIERAVAEISAAHPRIASLRCDDNTVMFESVRAAFAEAQEDEMRDAFAALNAVLLLIVARLLGNQIAERLTEGLTVADILHKGGLGGQ